MRRLPPHGAAGLAGIVVAEILLFAGVEPVRVFFTPIVWTAYIFFADGLVFAKAGRSQWSDDRAELLRSAAIGIPIWLIFEAYNLLLRNWAYVGLPESAPLRLLGYGWSFATILPGLFVTSDLLLAYAGVPLDVRRGRVDDVAQGSPGTRVALIVLGALCLLFPLAVPAMIAPYLFAPVWVGFIFLLDPVNASAGRWSPFSDWARGQKGRLASLLAGGLLCGILWEFWNYWAGAKWIYTFPMFQGIKVFEMPAPGFLGFPPFAVECFLIYDLISTPWGGGWGRRLGRVDLPVPSRTGAAA